MITIRYMPKGGVIVEIVSEFRFLCDIVNLFENVHCEYKVYMSGKFHSPGRLDMGKLQYCHPSENSIFGSIHSSMEKL